MTQTVFNLQVYPDTKYRLNRIAEKNKCTLRLVCIDALNHFMDEATSVERVKEIIELSRLYDIFMQYSGQRRSAVSTFKIPSEIVSMFKMYYEAMRMKKWSIFQNAAIYYHTGVLTEYEERISDGRMRIVSLRELKRRLFRYTAWSEKYKDNPERYNKYLEAIAIVEKKIAFLIDQRDRFWALRRLPRDKKVDESITMIEEVLIYKRVERKPSKPKIEPREMVCRLQALNIKQLEELMETLELMSREAKGTDRQEAIANRISEVEEMIMRKKKFVNKDKLHMSREQRIEKYMERKMNEDK